MTHATEKQTAGVFPKTSSVPAKNAQRTRTRDLLVEIGELHEQAVRDTLAKARALGCDSDNRPPK